MHKHLLDQVIDVLCQTLSASLNIRLSQFPQLAGVILYKFGLVCEAQKLLKSIRHLDVSHQRHSITAEVILPANITL